MSIQTTARLAEDRPVSAYVSFAVNTSTNFFSTTRAETGKRPSINETAVTINISMGVFVQTYFSARPKVLS
jgi:hypothetical protein